MYQKKAHLFFGKPFDAYVLVQAMIYAEAVIFLVLCNRRRPFFPFIFFSSTTIRVFVPAHQLEQQLRLRIYI